MFLILSPLLPISFFWISIWRGSSPTPSLDHMVCSHQAELWYRAVNHTGNSPWKRTAVLKAAMDQVTHDIPEHLPYEDLRENGFQSHKQPIVFPLGALGIVWFIMFPILRWLLKTSQLNLLSFKILCVELPCDPAVPLVYMSKRTENRVSKTYLFIQVPRLVIPNSREVEDTQLSIDRWMYKQNVV